jgi:hypothetical protein
MGASTFVHAAVCVMGGGAGCLGAAARSVGAGGGPCGV